MGGKPRLPREIELFFPVEIVSMIYKYVPKHGKPSLPSPSFQREVQRIQRGLKRNAMDLYGLEDFVLC